MNVEKRTNVFCTVIKIHNNFIFKMQEEIVNIHQIVRKNSLFSWTLTCWLKP